MSLEGKRIAILVEELYEDLEFWYPYYRLKEEGAEVKSIGPTKGKIYKSKHGYPVEAELGIRGLKAEEFDAVIIPGGYAPDRMRVKPEMVDFVKSAVVAEKVVAAICHGPWMLVSADVLRGKKATCYVAIRDDVKNAGAEFADKEMVIDGKIITSRTPADLPAFLKAIIAALKA